MVSNKIGREDLSILIPNPCIWENSLFHILLTIETNFRKFHVVTLVWQCNISPPVCFSGGRPNFSKLLEEQENRQTLNKERPIF